LVLGGTLSTASWRWAILAAVPFGVLILALVPWAYARTPGSTAASTLPRADLHLGHNRIGVRTGAGLGAGWGDAWAIGTLVGALLLLTGTVVIESRASQPIIPLRLLTDRRRGGAYATLLLVGTLGGTLLFCLFQFMQDVLGFSRWDRGGIPAVRVGVAGDRVAHAPVTDATGACRRHPAGDRGCALANPAQPVERVHRGAARPLLLLRLRLRFRDRVTEPGDPVPRAQKCQPVRSPACSRPWCGWARRWVWPARSPCSPRRPVRERLWHWRCTGFASAFGLTVVFYVVALIGRSCDATAFRCRERVDDENDSGD